MFRLGLYLFTVVFLTSSLSAQRQVRVIKPVKTHLKKTNLSLGVGITNSSLFLQRNTLDDNNVLGLHTSLVYDASRLLRVSLEYTRYGQVDISPTWENIKAHTLEANLHILYHSKGNLYFYPIAGLSYNVFQGYFTGINDFLNLSAKYPKNQDVVTHWLGFNAGVGLEYTIKPIIIFANCKMRVGFSENNRGLNVVDVCYTAGIRYNFRVPTFYELFKGPRNRYFLDTDK